MSEPAPQNVSVSEGNFLASVPEHWKILDLKFVATITPSNVDKKTVDGQPPVLLCNYTDVYYNDVIHRNLSFMKATATCEQIEKFTLKKWDVLFTKDSETADDIGIPALVAENLEGVLCGYHLSILRAHTSSVGPYLKYCLESSPSKAYFECTANGLTRVGLGQYAINNLPVCVPPVYEQRQIAAYLNRETAKIDKLIAKQQKLIKLLQEKRQAVISQAVTKGLDPNVKMKDSGVEWLGEVPEHWSVIKLGFLYQMRSGDAITIENIEVEGSFPVYGGNGLRGYSEKYTHNGDFLLMGRQGALCGNIHKVSGKFWASEHAVVLKPFITCIPSYMANLLRHMNLGQYSVSAAQPGLSVDVISKLRIPFPPIEEQLKIAGNLDEQESSVRNLVEKSMISISLLHEHRQALITAAVTGKIDVRGLVTDEEVAALDAEPEVETTEEDFSSDVVEDSYITEEE